MTGLPAPIRVLIVDDSPTVRAVLRRLLRGAGDIEVVGEAGDGAEAIQAAIAGRPDIVLMDIEMPVMDGYTACERIMALCPTAILVVTSRANRDQLATAFEALRRGALDVLAKPADTAGWERLATTLPDTVRALVRGRTRPPLRQPAGSAPSPRPEAGPHPAGAGRAPAPGHPSTAPALPLPGLASVRLVGVGASTGGPGAVRDFLAALPADLPAPVLLVQHIAAGFEEGLAEWLAGDLGREVRLALDGEVARPGIVYVAPGGAHLRVAGGGALVVDTTAPPRGGHRPAVDELFFSLAAVCPRQAAGVLLTGMGSDGADGLLALRRAGGITMVQDEASSVVFGMPRAALARGAAELALPPRELACTLARYWHLEKR